MGGSQLQWLSPEWLILIPIIWLYLLWKSLLSNQAHQPSFDNEPTIALAESKTSTFHHPLASLFAKDKSNARSRNSVYLWTALIMTALLIALAQPILRGEKLPDPPPERDIVFLVDTSISMQLKDYKINDEAISRMDLLRQLLDEFASRMKGERISVIIFAEKAYKLVPLSNDQNLIRSMLQRVTTSLAGRYSDIGSALLLALQEAKKQEFALQGLTLSNLVNKNLTSQNSDNKNKRHQTFILFSDADESRGDVDVHAASALLAENEIPLFSIAIGGNNDGKEKTEGGMYHPVNMQLFNQLAEETKGKSYRVENSDSLEKAIQDISKLRKNIALQEPQFVETPLYYYPLLLGLVLLFLKQLLTLIGNRR